MGSFHALWTYVAVAGVVDSKYAEIQAPARAHCAGRGRVGDRDRGEEVPSRHSILHVEVRFLGGILPEIFCFGSIAVLALVIFLRCSSRSLRLALAKAGQRVKKQNNCSAECLMTPCARSSRACSAGLRPACRGAAASWPWELPDSLARAAAALLRSDSGQQLSLPS